MNNIKPFDCYIQLIYFKKGAPKISINLEKHYCAFFIVDGSDKISRENKQEIVNQEDGDKFFKQGEIYENTKTLIKLKN